MKSNPELDKNLKVLTNLLKPIVENIEANAVPITQNNYGDYMTVIASVGDRAQETDPERLNKIYLGIGAALCLAGANRKGVNAALSIMGVL